MVWKRSSQSVREKKLAAEYEMKDFRMMHYFLGPEVWQRQDEIFLNQGKNTRNPKEVWDVGYQGNDYTYGIKYEIVVGYDFRDCGCYFIQADGGFVDELDEHKMKYMFCCEHPQSIYGAT
jgi:hypothetical protein